MRKIDDWEFSKEDWIILNGYGRMDALIECMERNCYHPEMIDTESGEYKLCIGPSCSYYGTTPLWKVANNHAIKNILKSPMKWTCKGIIDYITYHDLEYWSYEDLCNFMCVIEMPEIIFDYDIYDLMEHRAYLNALRENGIYEDVMLYGGDDCFFDILDISQLEGCDYYIPMERAEEIINRYKGRTA